MFSINFNFNFPNCVISHSEELTNIHRKVLAHPNKTHRENKQSLNALKHSHEGLQHSLVLSMGLGIGMALSKLPLAKMCEIPE